MAKAILNYLAYVTSPWYQNRDPKGIPRISDSQERHLISAEDILLEIYQILKGKLNHGWGNQESYGSYQRL